MSNVLWRYNMLWASLYKRWLILFTRQSWFFDVSLSSIWLILVLCDRSLNSYWILQWTMWDTNYSQTIPNYSSIGAFEYSRIHVFTYSRIQVFKYTIIRVFEESNYQFPSFDSFARIFHKMGTCIYSIHVDLTDTAPQNHKLVNNINVISLPSKYNIRKFALKRIQFVPICSFWFVTI